MTGMNSREVACQRGRGIGSLAGLKELADADYPPEAEGKPSEIIRQAGTNVPYAGGSA